MTRSLAEAQSAALLAQIPLGRLGQASEVAHAGGVSRLAGSVLHHGHRIARQRRHVDVLSAAAYPGAPGATP
jgi:hypothetical protein